MWKNININKQNIVVATNRAMLIAMPHNSDYNGYSFWHPSKLIREGRHSYAISVGYTDDFTFTLVKYGKGKWKSREIVSQKKISASEFEDNFVIMDENIIAPTQSEESYIKVQDPKKLDLDIQVKEELKNNQ